MTKLSINVSRASHEHHGGRPAYDLLHYMRIGDGYGRPTVKMDHGQEWWTWSAFPADCVEGCRATFARLGVPATAIRTSGR